MANTGGVFRCPSCKEFISTGVNECRFCGAAVNAEEAKSLTRKQGELDDAIGGARTIKLMGPMILVLIPLTTLVSLLFPVGLSVILEYMTIRWLIRFAKVKTPEVQRLRWQVGLFAVLGLVAFVITALFVLVVFLRAALRATAN
jgi:hypothetical protein